MEINFDVTMKNFDGKKILARDVVKNEAGEEKVLLNEIKLKDVAMIALSSTKEEITPEEKSTLFSIGVKIANGGIVDLESKEIAELEKVCGKSLSTLLWGQVKGILNGKPVFKEEEVVKSE